MRSLVDGSCPRQARASRSFMACWMSGVPGVEPAVRSLPEKSTAPVVSRNCSSSRLLSS